MKSVYLYFIDDTYYNDFKHKDLKPNKTIDANGNPHNRPCYYAFKEGDIVWMVPVSSQLTKYQSIYDKKTKDGKDCDTIVFGYVKGNKNVFLIQNMIPITEDYIKNVYMDKSTGNPIEINKKTKKELNAKVRKVLRLTRNNIAKVVFPPILEIEKELNNRLNVSD